MRGAVGALILDFVWFDLDFFFGKMRERAITILLEDRFPDFLLRFCVLLLWMGEGSCVRNILWF